MVESRSGHPVAAAVACVHEALDAVVDAPVWSLSEAEAGVALLALGAESVVGLLSRRFGIR
ncbi:hypothetical protein [Nocardioides ochotonae]|uniref:hypothetical protein n=1 Tax=Nocardioides ochotonae TaxID=2685869 RepID=UPI00140BEB38|nr:hypothetical protein [Nocardioides ochotonae]